MFWQNYLKDTQKKIIVVNTFSNDFNINNQFKEFSCVKKFLKNLYIDTVLEKTLFF